MSRHLAIRTSHSHALSVMPRLQCSHQLKCKKGAILGNICGFPRRFSRKRFFLCRLRLSIVIWIWAMLGGGSGTRVSWTGVTSGVLREVQGACKEATPATPGAHCSEWSIASPAQQGAPATTCPDPYRTPSGGPQADPCLALAPFLFEEGRPLQRLKEKRKQRQLARSPYARRPVVLTTSGASAGARRKLLEEEQQRLLGLPRGEVIIIMCCPVGTARCIS